MSVFENPKFNHPGFHFFLRRSTYVHILLVVSTMISGKIAYNLNLSQQEKNMELIQASVRVDMVAMPTHTINELKNLSSGVEEAKKEEKTPEIVKEEKTETKVEPKAEKVAEKAEAKENAFEEAQEKKRKDFLSKLKTIGNKKVESEGKQKAEKGLYGEKQTALKDLVLSGNKLKTGTQMTGEGNAAEMTAYHAYVLRLPDIIRVKWTLPSYLADKKLKCRVRISINPSGEVSKMAIQQSSGESDYDQRAMDAIRASAPFPNFSKNLGNRTENIEVVLAFPL